MDFNESENTVVSKPVTNTRQSKSTKLTLSAFSIRYLKKKNKARKYKLRITNGTSSANPVDILLDVLKSKVRSENSNANQLKIATVNDILESALPDAIQIKTRLKDTKNTKKS